MEDQDTDDASASLRKDIRQVTTLLGETLARVEGPGLLDLVERVREHARESRLDELFPMQIRERIQ